MNVSIVSKKIELTDAMKAHVETVTEQFTKYNLDIIAVKTIISETKNHKKPGVEVEFTIQLPKRDTIVIRQGDLDFYAACDIAVERAKKVLRRTHDKMKTVRADDEHKAEADVPSMYSDVDEDEIVPADLELHKPIEPQEALDDLKTSNAMFKVFKDIDGNTRVIYRRKDGKFGLY